jgi:hypothetical protein
MLSDDQQGNAVKSMRSRSSSRVGAGEVVGHSENYGRDILARCVVVFQDLQQHLTHRLGERVVMVLDVDRCRPAHTAAGSDNWGACHMSGTELFHH